MLTTFLSTDHELEKQIKKISTKKRGEGKNRSATYDKTARSERRDQATKARNC